MGGDCRVYCTVHGDRGTRVRSFSRIQSIRQIVFVPLGVRVGSQNISQFSFHCAHVRTKSLSLLLYYNFFSIRVGLVFIIVIVVIIIETYQSLLL